MTPTLTAALLGYIIGAGFGIALGAWLFGVDDR